MCMQFCCNFSSMLCLLSRKSASSTRLWSLLVYVISLGNIQMDPTQANHRWTPALVYRIGQKVWFSTQHLPLWESKKLTPRFVSPFIIQRVISLVAVRLQAPEIHGGPPHVSKVKPSGPACPPSVCPCLA